MKLVSVNLAHTGTPLEGGKPIPTGIFKKPALEAVQVGPLGLEGDHIGDTKNHGGPDQAVYLYALEDYAWWSAELGRPLGPGTFGENLTLEGQDFSTLNLGDVFTFGPVRLEVTFPRIPCVTLAARMGDPTFVKRFVRAERPGVYCRVLDAGEVRAGLAGTFQPFEGERVSAVEAFRFWHAKDRDWGVLERALKAPLAGAARAYFEQLERERRNS